MLQVVLCVQQKNSLLVVDNQIVLLVDVGQAVAHRYLDRQNGNEDDHEEGDHHSYTETDTSNMSDLCQQLVIFVLKESIF